VLAVGHYDNKPAQPVDAEQDGVVMQKGISRKIEAGREYNEALSNVTVLGFRKETDSLGEVDVPSAKLWGAQTQRSLEHFSIGHDLIPREMIAAYATLKKAAANANHAGGRLDERSPTFTYIQMLALRFAVPALTASMVQMVGTR
jgi:hypothetical protein